MKINLSTVCPIGYNVTRETLEEIKNMARRYGVNPTFVQKKGMLKKPIEMHLTGEMSKVDNFNLKVKEYLHQVNNNNDHVQ